MFSDAWEATEELPPEDRSSEPALVIRLQTLTAIAQWDLGNHVASLLIYAGEEITPKMEEKPTQKIEDVNPNKR